MIPAQQLLSAIVDSLRKVIAPAISDPYPKTQAYMAAVILEFIQRQVEERGDLAGAKAEAFAALLEQMQCVPTLQELTSASGEPESALCGMIEHLYACRDQLGEEAFQAANQMLRAAARRMLDAELKIAGKNEG